MNTLFHTLTVAGLAGLLAALPAPAAPGRAAAETYQVDGAHSTVLFHAKHLGISQAYGRFNHLSDKSRIVLESDLAKSSVLLVVDAESVDTNSPDRDKHLRNADFFNSKEFPEIVFESQKITGTPEAMEVSGELTFHGVTKSVKAKAQRVGEGDAFGGHRVGFLAEFTIDMREFDVEFLKKNPGAVGPEVGLTVSLECVRQ